MKNHALKESMKPLEEESERLGAQIDAYQGELHKIEVSTVFPPFEDVDGVIIIIIIRV